MSDKSKQMKQELWKVSNFIALSQTRRFETISLALCIVYILSMRFAYVPIYILIVLHALPLILSFWIKDYAIRFRFAYLLRIVNDDKFLLNQLKEKYHYNKLDSLSKTITQAVTIFLLSLWQYQFYTLGHPNIIFKNLPICIVIGTVLIRVVAPLIYYIRLHKALSMNKV